MPRNTGKRRASTSNDVLQMEFELHKDRIYQLYITENRSLNETMVILRSQYNFNAPKKQYESKLKEWKFRKNVDWADMPMIVKIVDHRWRQGKRTDVVWHTTDVTDERMARFVKDRKMRQVSPSPIGPIPSHIRYSTPHDQPMHFSDPNAWVSHVLSSASRNSADTPRTPADDEEPPQHRVSLPLNQVDMVLVQQLRGADSYSTSGPVQPTTSYTMASSPPAGMHHHIAPPQNVYTADLLQTVHTYIETNDIQNVLAILRNLRHSVLESAALPRCLYMASKIPDGIIFRILILGALFTDTAATCPEHLVKTAQRTLQPLLNTGITHLFGFLFRSRIISPEAARERIMKSLFDGHTAILEQFLSEHNQLREILDLDAMMFNADAIRDTISVHGPDAARMVVLAAFNASIVSPGRISAIHLSVAWLLRDDTRDLLDNGANMDQKNSTDQSPLHMLAGMADSAIMPTARLLMDYGVNIHTRDFVSDNCLHTLVKCGPEKQWTKMFAELLVGEGLDINARDANGQTVLTIIMQKWSPAKVAEWTPFLLQNGAVY